MREPVKTVEEFLAWTKQMKGQKGRRRAGRARSGLGACMADVLARKPGRHVRTCPEAYRRDVRHAYRELDQGHQPRMERLPL